MGAPAPILRDNPTSARHCLVFFRIHLKKMRRNDGSRPSVRATTTRRSIVRSRSDLAALEAATGERDEKDRDAVTPELASFLPSLHLNVGDAYRRLADYERARRHAANGLKRADVLPDNGFSTMIKGGLERLQARLSAER